MVLNDASRNRNFKHKTPAKKPSCDFGSNLRSASGASTSPDWKGEGWYRMVKPAGTQFPEQHPPPVNHCGTLAVGYLTGSHPREVGQSVNRTVCFSWSHKTKCKFPCSSTCKFRSEITVINCGGYFVYELPDTPSWCLRYCAE